MCSRRPPGEVLPPGVSRSFRSTVLQGSFALLLAVGGCASASLGVPTPGPEEIPVLEAHLRERPGDAGILIRLGAAYLEAGRSADALPVLRSGATLRPDDPTANLLLGLAFEGEEAWEEAAERYAAVLAAGNAGSLAPRIRDRLAHVRRRALEVEIRDALAREVELADTSPTPGTVAVFPFQVATSDDRYTPLGRAFAEFMTGGLAQVDRVRVVERQRVQLLLDEMALGEEGLVDPGSAARSGRLLGAARIVQGRLDISGDEPGAEELEILASVVAIGMDPVIGGPYADRDALGGFYELQERVVLALFGSLGIELTSAERERVTRRPTESLQALLAFGRALEAEDRGDFGMALEAFRDAAALDPGFDEASEGIDRAGALQTLAGAPVTGVGSTGDLPGIPGTIRDPAAEWGVGVLSGGGAIANTTMPTDPDPAQEILDQDRTGSASAILRILIRRPGG